MEWNFNPNNKIYMSTQSVWTRVSAKATVWEEFCTDKGRGQKKERVSQETMQYSSEGTKQMQFWH